MTIRLHRLRRLSDNSLELWIHGSSDSDANYVASILKELQGTEVSEPYTKPGSKGVFKYISVRSTQGSEITSFTVFNKIASSPYIEIMDTTVAFCGNTSTVGVQIQGRIFALIEVGGNGNFAYEEIEEGHYVSETTPPPALKNSTLLRRNEVWKRLSDLGMSETKIKSCFDLLLGK